MNINMEFVKTEIANQVVDKLDNMCCSEISEELFEFLEDKTEAICKSVYSVLENNEPVLDNEYGCLRAQDGFCEELIGNWDVIDEMNGEEREREIQSTILYNYDALWMVAIHKAFPTQTTDVQCGWGEMEFISE